jgi:predicted ATPase/class 3 adenylate cyclase
MATKRAVNAPSGTVAMLFTDIEASTRLAQRLPDRYQQLLDRHRSILRTAFEQHNGYEVNTEGDSFFVVFAKPLEALSAAADAQRGIGAERWPADGVVRVRMGLHVGDVELQGGDYVGVEVHRAARIGAAAHGGQVLLSGALAALISDRLPRDLELRDLGEFQLKDFDAPVRIHQLLGPGLATQTGGVSAPSARRGNLPERRSSFIGREEELAAVAEALGRSRLVTLTGPGGTGKTTLALEAAREALADHRDGAWLVELAPLPDPGFAVSTINRALGLGEDPTRSAEDLLAAFLANRQLLLVMDNLEQLLPDAATLVDRLLEAAPGLKVLATTREPLHVAGEQEIPIPPLDLPNETADLDALTATEAVRLFVDRARAVQPAFSLTDANQAAVAGLVRRLDGLPLAIELAAARLKLLKPDEILDRLTRGTGELVSTGAAVPERQRTLRDAIGWSYRLLGAPEQAFFARLSVFAGGCSLDSAEAVCAEGEGIGALELLASLVDKSLVRRTEGAAGTRFELLETIRDYARERLMELDPAGATADTHAKHMLAIAEEAAPHLTEAAAEPRQRLDDELDNLRAALAWAVTSHDAETGLRLCAGLWRFWHMRALLAEGRDWCDRVFAIPGADELTPARVRAQLAAGSVAYWMRDKDAAGRYYNEALEGAQQLGDRRLEADALVDILYLISVFPEMVDPGQLEIVEQRIRHLSAELEDPVISAHANFARAGRLVADQRLDEAIVRAATTLEIFEATGDLFLAASANNILAGIALRHGEPERSVQLGVRSVELFEILGDDIPMQLTIHPLASAVAQNGNAEAGARLAGYSARLVADTGGIRFTPPFAPEDAMDVARRLIGEEHAQREWEAGRWMSREEAMALIRSLPEQQEKPNP